MEDDPRRFVRMSEDDLQVNLSRVQDEALREALNFGIGIHHAGLVEADRKLAEELFANNKIQVLIATSTLAWGINLPAHLVVVKGTQYFDAKIEGYKDMDLTDVLQMLGRAGRPQYDSSGIARIFTQDAKKAFYKHFLHTGFPVESSLHNVLDNHLGAEVAAETIATKQDALDYLTWTFFFRRLHKNPSYYGLEIPAEEHDTIEAQRLASNYLTEIVDRSLDELAQSSCISIHSNGEVESTPFGKVMSYYYLSHRTIRHVVNQAKRGASFEDALSLLCNAIEFDDLPVRHNEDIINTELSSNLPLGAGSLGLPMGDPHVKAFLLLQAYMSRIDLPISDYVGDQNSVLDQSIRIIQASIDVMTELGYLSSCKSLMTLLQCIKSALWPQDGPLSILPGVDIGKERRRCEMGKTRPYSLSEIHDLPKDELQDILHDIGGRSNIASQALKTIDMLPHLKVNVSGITALGLTVAITRLNRSTQLDYRIWAPRFPKPQTEGFFTFVADPAKDEVLALKRFSWPSEEKGYKRAATAPAVRAEFKLEPGGVDRRVEVWVVSDAYPGMMWKLEDVDIPGAPKVVGGGGKKH
ncbi:MAG: hypothetical protein Q9214_005989 [Letrouitia sp. 1 TL-2023]